MGTWGNGIFDNDDALDWAAELDTNGIEAVATALNDALSVEYLDAYEGARALAAAAVVAVLGWGDDDSSAYPETVLEWVHQNRIDPSSFLVEQSLAAIDRVRGEDSELSRMWSQAGDAMNGWLAILAEYESLLSS